MFVRLLATLIMDKGGGLPIRSNFNNYAYFVQLIRHLERSADYLQRFVYNLYTASEYFMYIKETKYMSFKGKEEVRSKLYIKA
jgi:phosphate uptake regulator